MNDYLKEESGGKTKVILVSRVHKEAADERMLKLVDEYEFIESIPEPFKNYFPRILFYGVNENKAFYEMEHYDLPTLRRLMLSNSINKDEVLYWTNKVTDVSLKLYKYKILNIPLKKYLNDLHFNRFNNRMKELSTKSNWFKDILHKKYITVNNKKYYNIPVLFEKFKTEKFINKIQPEFIGRWSHSDLHYSNILIDRDNDKFIMIDPRGYDYCDYYYDFGKLWHSVNGKYEMIASRQFDLSEEYYKLHDNKMFNLCESLKEPLIELLCQYSNESKDDVIMKTEWNEVIHFCTLIPFLLDYDNINARSKVAYYTSVLLINNFCEKYGI
jgi:serine/threonine protein kinase